MFKFNLIVLAFVAVFFTLAYCAPEQGKFYATLSEEQTYFFVKTLYNQSEITIRVEPNKDFCTDKSSSFYIQWMVRGSSCYAEYSGIENGRNEQRARTYMYRSDQIEELGVGKWIANYDPSDDSSTIAGDLIHCSDTGFILKAQTGKWQDIKRIEKAEEKEEGKSENEVGGDANKDDDEETKSVSNAASSKIEPTVSAVAPKESVVDAGKKDDIKNTTNHPARKKRSDDQSDGKVTEKTATKTPAPKPANTQKSSGHVMAITPEENAYIVIINIRRLNSDTNVLNGSFNVTVEMKTPKGYLSAHEYPFLTFYMIMCIVYVFYAVAWLILSACNYKDLLRVQFWIGAVILLGMIEKAVFYSDYLNVNTTGISVLGAAKFAEIVSALKRSLARMLCIIVSLGFGIVKPRLGPMLHRVIGVGVLYFVLAVVEALVRQDSDLHEPENTNLLLTFIPLSVLDAVICWWVFISLMQTMKTLRLRRNVVKLSLYRHFSNAIIFSVVASLIMIFWSFRIHKDICLTDWNELWIEQAFWHLLFSVVLLVIIVLWRPSANNQRYAFSPLIDGGSDDEGLSEQLLGSGATETMKMRGTKMETSGKYAAEKAEDNLKWIEENIPQTVADAALPALLDSDEEIMTTKYEMSKME